MTFKEFVTWCADRACDGRWGSWDAIVCIDIMHEVNSIPWWRFKKRKAAWAKYEPRVVQELVNPINAKIKEATE